jgi:outer membrane receptor protein involved in Fe transport
MEHTFQADIVKPFTKNQKLEMGVKYILRSNISLTDVYLFDYTLQDFVIDSSQINDFDYTQNIFAGYFSYNKKFEKLSIKGGLRIEDVWNNGTFTSTSYTDFEYKNLEYVPTANVAYQVNEKNSLRISYNKRIQRPGIWHLNPYVFNADPKNIFFGNPNLDPERFHNFELNYNLNSKIGNINLTFYNSFSNNAIDRVVKLEDGISKSTFDNISKIRTWGTSSFISLRFGKKVNANVNSTLNYNSIEGNKEMNLSNSGWSYNVSTNITYNIIQGLRLSGNAFLFKPQVSLQTTRSNFYNMGFSLAKEFYKGKLTFTLTARNIFWEEMKFSFKTYDQAFYQEMEMFRPGRSFGINIRYKFGEMNTQLKKASRGIRNDDVKQGEGNGNGG